LGGGVGRQKKKKEKISQLEVEKKVIWRLLMGGDKHNEKSKIKFKKNWKKIIPRLWGMPTYNI
jgi:hypothetical protein